MFTCTFNVVFGGAANFPQSGPRVPPPYDVLTHLNQKGWITLPAYQQVRLSSDPHLHLWDMDFGCKRYWQLRLGGWTPEGEELSHLGEFKVELLLLCIENSHFRWFGHLSRMPLGFLSLEVFWARSTWRTVNSLERLCIPFLLRFPLGLLARTTKLWYVEEIGWTADLLILQRPGHYRFIWCVGAGIGPKFSGHLRTGFVNPCHAASVSALLWVTKHHQHFHT